MNKKYVEFKIEDQVVAVCAIKECSPLEFIQKEREAKANLEKLVERLNKLEEEIKVLKGED